MQVRDEADIIEAALLRWIGMGAEMVFVFDDRSTDDTRKILERIGFNTGRVGFVRREAEPYQMAKHINLLKDLLVRHYACNWIIPADADEVWHFPNNNPAAFFASLPQTPSCGEVPYYDNFPNGLRRLHTHKKCFGYLTKEMEISIGNHMILDGDKWPKIENHGIYIEHYPVRSYEQMRRKLINHMEVYSIQHPKHAHAQNWHKWQEMGEAFFQEKWKEFNPQT